MRVKTELNILSTVDRYYRMRRRDGDSNPLCLYRTKMTASMFNQVTAPDAASPVRLPSDVRGRGTGEFFR